MNSQRISEKLIFEITSIVEIEELVLKMKRHPKFKESLYPHYIDGMNTYAKYLRDITPGSDNREYKQYSDQEVEEYKVEEHKSLIRRQDSLNKKEKIVRQIVERRYLEEQRRQEETIFSSLTYRLSDKKLYSYGYRDIGEQVLEYFNNMYLEEEFSTYIDETMCDYDMLRTKMEEQGFSKELCNAFEDLISEIYEGEIESADNSIILFIERLYREINGTICFAIDGKESLYSDKMYGSQNEVSEEIQSVRREQSIQKRVVYERDYNKILEYIKVQKIPVDKKQIIKEIPGINKNTLREVLLHEPKVLNFYGMYMWYDNLSINYADIQVVTQHVENVISDYETHHITEVYEELKYCYSDFLKRNMINTPHRLFSVVQVMCEEIISFERPYIAKKDVMILNAKERIDRFIQYEKEVSVKELLEYASSNYMHIGNILHMLNELNDSHIFRDKLTLISLQEYDLTYSLGRKVENVFLEEVENQGVLAIGELTSSKKLPEISLEWNEWLVYSLLLKWGNKLRVTTAGNNFREAIPVVYIGAAPDEEELETIGRRARGKTLGSALDISNVDDVLEDVLDDILDDLEF